MFFAGDGMRDLVQLAFTGALPSCAVCQIKDVGVCARSGAQELEWLEQSKAYRHYPAGSIIAMPGTELTHIGTVMIGLASLSRLLEDGRRQTIGILHPGDFLGRPGRAITPFMVEAVTDVDLCGFGNDVFARLLAKSPDLHGRLIELMLDELDAARDWLVMLGQKTAREKFCGFFVYLTYRQYRLKPTALPHDPCLTVHLPMTREQVADFLALSMETVSRQFSALIDEGLIRPIDRYRFALPDFQLLLEAAGDDEDGGALF
jgi:CRP/FNR family transcriptional regulator, anaerobic regulatory protein